MSKMKENIIIAISVSICALFVTTIALLALWVGCPTGHDKGYVRVNRPRSN